MVYNETAYVSKPVDAKGYADYTKEEDSVWHDLISRQQKIIINRGCDEYIHGLKLLNLPQDRVPQCHEVSKVLQETTGWALEPVPALIPFEKFFTLLANRRFPAATFIRTREDFDYIKEPDLFHEIFGHSPMLTNPAYAQYAEHYGKLGLSATPAERVKLARLFWFTVEFGLIETPAGIRAYGGGILSSIEETVYSIESTIPERRPFDVIDALLTPYRIDIKQPIYFVIKNFNQLFELAETDLMALVRKTNNLHDHVPPHPC